ncbi:flavodoxin [Vibrio natriegens]|uniref:flavodoxin n=1 Tax=Vibrio natriegens TaxID=691 RepID=UPI000AF1A88C|nr:flavodoxin [Vibrio natriegens]
MWIRCAYILLGLVLLVTFNARAEGNHVSRERVVFKKNKVLIVYLSRTQNTKAVADMIQRYTKGDLVSIELVKPYPSNYRKTVEQVKQENESNYLPELKTRIENIEQYDTVFIGFPTWGMQLPPPMKSFLSSYSLSNKTVIPFNTNAGYGIGSSFAQVIQLCERCNVRQGISFVGGIERDGKLLEIKQQRAKDVETEVVKWLGSL